MDLAQVYFYEQLRVRICDNVHQLFSEMLVFNFNQFGFQVSVN